MFDFTPHIRISEGEQLSYRIARGILWIFLLFLVIQAFFLVVFPDADGYFDFRVYYGGKNTIAGPRFADGTLVEKGEVNQDKTMLFNFSSRGQYSTVDVTFTPRSVKASHGTVQVVRSYRALLYPDGDAAMFRDGSFLSYQGSSYLISQGKARRFASTDIVKQSGYTPEMAEEITTEEKNALTDGTPILDASDIPDGKIVFTSDQYYQYLNNLWVPFVSDRAYLSQYRREDAAGTDRDIASIADPDHLVGFLSGTILSYGEAVYVVEGDTLRPVDSPETYLTKGYAWESVIPATGEEFGMYQLGKLYNIREPHPSGTLFFMPSHQIYYLINQGKRHLIMGPHLIQRFSSITPVMSDVTSPASCILSIDMLGNGHCTLDISQIEGVGAEYQFSATFQSSVSLTEMSTTFRRHVNQSNWQLFLTDLKQKLMARYQAS